MIQPPDDRPLPASKMNELKTLRDEIRLGLHLAGMDFKDEWQKIERTLPDLSRTAAQLGDAASETLDRLAAELRRFQDRLRKRGGAHDPQAPSS